MKNRNLAKTRKLQNNMVIFICCRQCTHVVVLVLVGTTSSKRPAPSFQIGSEWNLAGLFFQ